MADDDHIAQYIDVSLLKASLNISKTNKKHDDTLAFAVIAANTAIDISLLPYTGDIPISTGTTLYTRAVQLALLHARARYYRDNNQLKLEEADRKEYDTLLKMVIESLRSEINTRTKRVSTGTPHKTRRLFSQHKRY